MARERPRVLVVEDDESFREVLVDFLDVSGYAVSSAIDGEEGLEKVDSERPAVVIADAMMPRLNGEELCAELARRPGGAPPVILISGDGRVVERATAAGARAFLRKPIDLHQLLALLARLTAA